MSDCRFGVSPVNYPDPDPGCAFPTFNEFGLMFRLRQPATWLQCDLRAPG